MTPDGVAYDREDPGMERAIGAVAPGGVVNPHEDLLKEIVPTLRFHSAADQVAINGCAVSGDELRKRILLSPAVTEEKLALFELHDRTRLIARV
jgi:hypothetical protein